MPNNFSNDYYFKEVEEEEPTGFICFEKFQPMMARVLIESRYKPASEDQLLNAFQVRNVYMLHDQPEV